jgi:two-component system nitrogen regulation sensor histidine kinase NtrY
VIARALALLALAAAFGAGIVLTAASARDEATHRAHERAEALADERAAALGRSFESVDAADPSGAARQTLATALVRGDEPVALVAIGAAPADLPTGASLRRVTRVGDRDFITWAVPEAVAQGRTLEWIALAGVGALTLAAMILLFLSRGSGHDRQLEAAVARIGKGDLDVTLDGNGATVSAFNRMTRELRDARTRLARAERIAAWRDIARRIAHEIKNPLTPIKMAMETARKTHARKHPDFDEIFDESTKTVLEEVNRLEHIVTEFSRFARLPRPDATSLNAREVVEKVVAMHDLDPAHATLPEAAKGVRVELSLGQSKFPEVRADREQLTQVLVNLVQNACDAAREKHGETGGRVVVDLAATDDAGVRITISDNGPGIPTEERSRILEPYYTTKAHGTGLGMAIVDRIVSDHGGSLVIDDSKLGGAAIVVTLRREGPPEEADGSAVGP